MDFCFIPRLPLPPTGVFLAGRLFNFDFFVAAFFLVGMVTSPMCVRTFPF